MSESVAEKATPVQMPVVSDPLYQQVIGSLEQDLKDMRIRCMEAESERDMLRRVDRKVATLSTRIESLEELVTSLCQRVNATQEHAQEAVTVTKQVRDHQARIYRA